MRALVAFNLWQWIEQNRATFEPPVGNKVIWEDSQFTAMIIRGPNARRDFHVDPSDEIFYMLKGDMVLESMRGGTRQRQVIREGELLLVPAFTPHSPHRPPDTWGLVIETTAAATPPRSMSSIDLAGVHVVLAGCSSGRPLTAVTQAGGAK